MKLTNFNAPQIALERLVNPDKDENAANFYFYKRDARIILVILHTFQINKSKTATILLTAILLT